MEEDSVAVSPIKSADELASDQSDQQERQEFSREVLLGRLRQLHKMYEVKDFIIFREYSEPENYGTETSPKLDKFIQKYFEETIESTNRLLGECGGIPITSRRIFVPGRDEEVNKEQQVTLNSIRESDIYRFRGLLGQGFLKNGQSVELAIFLTEGDLDLGTKILVDGSDVAELESAWAVDDNF